MSMLRRNLNLIKNQNFKVPYITDGLLVYVDGIENTESGHSDTTIEWKNWGSDTSNVLGCQGTWVENACSFITNKQVPYITLSSDLNARSMSYEVVFKITNLHDYNPLFQKFSQNTEWDAWVSGTGKLCSRVKTSNISVGTVSKDTPYSFSFT